MVYTQIKRRISSQYSKEILLSWHSSKSFDGIAVLIVSICKFSSINNKK